MQWLNKVIDDILAAHPEGEIIIESGSSPSGTYHLGHLRELVTCDAILVELKKRGRKSKHVAYVDDLDALRKIPVNLSSEYEKYLGVSLCDIPAPDGSKRSYADYFLQDLIDAGKALSMDIDFIRTHEKYRAGFFVPAIERSLEHVEEIRPILENVSGHKLGDDWSPIQINEGGYLKKRKFLSIDTNAKSVEYEDLQGNRQAISYSKGDVKLDWRIDWPARWWLLDVNIEPFGRDHATKGGSYDTGSALSRKVFGHEPPMPVPYDFVNLAGDPKKMSASRGTGVGAIEAVQILPPEVVRFFMMRYPPSKRLYLDIENVYRLIDQYESFVVKAGKTPEEKWLAEFCLTNLDSTVSSVPFSHLVASYQASLRDADKTIELLRRNTNVNIDGQENIIRQQLKFVNNWLDKWAPEDVKFELVDKIDPSKFSEQEKAFLAQLSKKIAQAPADADGEWFHKAIYDLGQPLGFEPKEIFQVLYKVLIGKESGPRAGWFLSILPGEWLIKRLKLEA